MDTNVDTLDDSRADEVAPAAADDELLVEDVSIDGMCGVY